MSILASHKYGIEYVEHCAIRAADDQLVYVRRKDAIEQHFNIPGLNTAVLLLGPGTSMTQQGARLCAEGNVLVGFCGGGATPIYLGSLNEYREPRYSRNWIQMFDDEGRRVATAKQFQVHRAQEIPKVWKRLPDLHVDPRLACEKYLSAVSRCFNVESLMLAEAAFTKELYALLQRNFNVEFSRKPKTREFANEYLDAGNYLAYGLAACCLWVLGIPFSYPVMHGKTRRGALVFDVADLIKDSYIMPNAFLSATMGESQSASRKRMLAFLHDGRALTGLFNEVLKVADTGTTSISPKKEKTI